MINLSLTSELESFINSAVKRGRYSSAEEMVSTPLQLLQEKELERTMRLEELRKEIAVGIADSDRGDVFDGEEVIKELCEEIKQGCI
ncbi:type II toxin-antitoxin system ParD family antitoxin [Okeania sp.]|uniref:type II toxin-antitoxin system ParD family antitoxin n=1 Tax=Okeania sp. TaxID=3100323 RepID=UPI002B4AF199|nr:type II toxin-antitoxin system ParD family antitoxin [Okeania sp.]MEB3342081.1 type II toxin-antitoxin system ParD family antitoxin [Okeania sp.]